MKSSEKLFMEYIEREARKWWESLSEQDRYPYHKTPWGFLDKWTIYGLYMDHLRGVGFSKKS